MTARIAPFVFLVGGLVHGSEPEPDPAGAITGDELIGHIRHLSSEELRGRASGSEDETRATEYVAAEFKRLGLEPAGEDGTWFQAVPLPPQVKVDKATSMSLEAPRAEPVAFELDKDFRPFSLSSTAKVVGEVVFAGYGVSAPKLEYDDYAGLDVSGKIVVIFRYAPQGDKQFVRAARAHAPFVAKLKQAADRGAIGLVVVNNPRNKKQHNDRLAPGGSRGKPRIPFVHMTLAAAERSFPALFGATPAELEEAIHKGEKPAPASRNGAAKLVIDAKMERIPIAGRNVCALLPAGAPEKIDEVVVVGAHHDHVGLGLFGSLLGAKGRNKIHNGADDNASGTAGVLEIAEHLATRVGTLRRSILFLTFTGEERGLVGSRYYTNHPTVPLEKTVAMINMDMIGRLDGRSLFIGGVGTSPVLKTILEPHVKTSGLKVAYGDGGMAPSDNTSFYAKKLPVLFFFTGTHDDYHRPTDDWDKIDKEGIVKVARLAAAVAVDVCNLEERPKFTRADRGGFGPPRAILGISIGPAEGGVGIRAVVDKGPAAHAGLQPGDVIVELGGKATPDFRALRGAMRGRKIGETIEVKFLRGDETQTVSVTLGSS
jgi:hypothetical protein